ncbi:MAG TPA: hypothetical protein DEH22_01690, partial [Chloroflexi bacterium]|nr:hypothetical protein [Chloroflexota bacterium]
IGKAVTVFSLAIDCAGTSAATGVARKLIVKTVIRMPAKSTPEMIINRFRDIVLLFYDMHYNKNYGSLVT